jgi:hypothetical protein
MREMLDRAEIEHEVDKVPPFYYQLTIYGENRGETWMDFDENGNLKAAGIFIYKDPQAF